MLTMTLERPALMRVSKVFGSIVMATAITLLLFFAMQQLIKPMLNRLPEPVPYVPVELAATPDDSDVITKPVMPPMPEPVVLDPMPSQPIVNPSVNVGPGIGLERPVIDTSTSHTIDNTISDRSATPLVRVEPRYPVDAARDGITGWVRLGFSIDESGSVTDVSVIQSEPRSIFDREAIRALRRWKYQPQIIDGKAIKQTNLQVQLDFQLQTD